MQILSRRTKNNPVLIGEPGVGKTAVVEGLAQRINAADVPELLKGKQIYTLDLAPWSRARIRGEFEERLKKVMKESPSAATSSCSSTSCTTSSERGGARAAIDAASSSSRRSRRGELQTIGATTLDEYRKYLERDSAWSAASSRSRGRALDRGDVQILKGLRDRYEQHHKWTSRGGARRRRRARRPTSPTASCPTRRST